MKATAIAAAAVLIGGFVHADVAMQKKAKELKIEAAQSCASCHTDKMPKKGAAGVNDMGKWLVDQKAARKAPAIDVAWLKDYKPKAK